MKIADSPLFQKSTRRFSTLVFYLVITIMMIAIDVRLSVLQNLRHSVKNFFLPTLLSMQNIGNLAEDVIVPHLQINKINLEFEELQKENLELIKNITQLQTLESENSQLREALTLKKDNKYNLVIGRIIYNFYGNRSLLINKGADDGVKLAQAVVNKAGLVGQIINVYSEYSEVGLISSNNINVPVRILPIENSTPKVVDKTPNTKNNEYFATLAGVSFEDEYSKIDNMGARLLEVKNYEQNFKFQIGDKLVTSGLANIFPIDLPAAKISKIETDTGFSGVRVLASPFANINHSKFVAVITTESEFSSWLNELFEKNKEEK